MKKYRVRQRQEAGSRVFVVDVVSPGGGVETLPGVHKTQEEAVAAAERALGKVRTGCPSCGRRLEIRQTEQGRQFWYCGNDACPAYGAQDWVGGPVHGQDYLYGRLP